jgi:hypothetical protein
VHLNVVSNVVVKSVEGGGGENYPKSDIGALNVMGVTNLIANIGENCTDKLWLIKEIVHERVGRAGKKHTNLNL